MFSKKGLSEEEESKEAIKEFVPEGAEFIIERLESEYGEATVIVKFSDKEKAKEFVESVNALSDAKKEWY